MAEPDIKLRREMGKENALLKRPLAERELVIDVMKGFLEQKGTMSQSVARSLGLVI